MDAKEFIRQCYLRSNPSVDLEKTTEKVDCTKHRLLCSEWDKLLEEFTNNENEKYAAMWLVCSGPQLVKD